MQQPRYHNNHNNTVIQIKLRDNLFTLVQLRPNFFMEFFNIAYTQAGFDQINLNNIERIFCIKVASQKFRSLMISRINLEAVTPNLRPLPNRMLSAIIEPGPRYGAKLIEFDKSFSELNATIIKENLNIKDDLELIYSYELSGMYGDPIKLTKRLLRYFDTRINWDESKEFLFKGIKILPANYKSILYN